MHYEIPGQQDKITLHYVDDDVKTRAQFAQIAVEVGYHCELYDSLDEILDYRPQHGLIVLKESADTEGVVVRAIDQMRKAGMWLAFIVVGSSPEPAHIVEAIKAGALDYLSLPVDGQQLQRCLARSGGEAQRISSLQRKKIEAQEVLKKLSMRETEVLEYLSDGRSNKEIARVLGISPRTVEVHRANMMIKLGATHPASAVRIKLDAERLQLT